MNTADLVKIAKKPSRSIDLVLTSDAHHSSELGRIRFAALNAERAAIDPARVVNTWPRERLVSWVMGMRA